LELKKVAMKRARESVAAKNKFDKRVKLRLLKVKKFTPEPEELKVDVVGSELEYKSIKDMLDHKERNFDIRIIKKIRNDMNAGKVGGSRVWPLSILQLVLEMLVTGTLPASIRPNIASQIAIIFPEVKINELPSI